MIQGTFDQTEISQAITRIINLGCDVWVEGTKLRLRGAPGPGYEEANKIFHKYHAGLIALLQGQRVNGFAESVEKANNPVAHAFLDEVYRKAFYNFDWCKRSMNGCTVAQKAGADVVIWTTAGRSYTADEKIRPNWYDYSDIALEYISNNKRSTPGWMEKDLSIDYLVYAFIPVRRAYLFPWQQLKMAWEKNKANWLLCANEKRDGFMVVSAPNPTYRTLSCAVPTDLLIEKVKESIVIQM